MPDKLESLATEINSAFRAVDSARVEAGRLLLKAQAAHAELLEKPCDPLIIASLKPCDPLIIASLLTFKGWCLRYIKRSYRDIMRCMALARAENPRAAVEAERSTARQGMRKTRAKQMTNVSHPRAAAAGAPYLRVVEPHSTQKPDIIQPQPTEQKPTRTKWKASSIVGDGIDPVVFEGDSQSMVYEDACEYMWDIWFGGSDTPDLPELKRFMALMAEFCPDIVWKFEQVKPSGADQVKAKVAEIIRKRSS